MKIIGLIAAGLGALVLLVSFGMDAAPEGTYNIGLLQHQMMLFQLGSVLAVVGTLLFAVGSALSRLERAGILPPANFKAPSPVPTGEEA